MEVIMIDYQEAKMNLTGPIASVSTPFLYDGSIDYKGLRNCVDFYVEGGSKTILLTYGDSLYSVLTDNEVAEVTKTVVQQTAGRAMVVAAERMWWTGKVVEFARYCKSIGADMLMVLPPDWSFSATHKTLAVHYETVSKEIPVMLVTALGNRPLPLETIEMLIDKNPRIPAVKDDISGQYGKKLATLVKGRMAYLCGGKKENFLYLYPYGADGYISKFMRFKTSIAHEFWGLVINKEFEKAAEYVNKYDAPFYDDLLRKFNITKDGLIHAAMEIYGLAERWRRPPYDNPDDEQMEMIKEYFKTNALL